MAVNIKPLLHFGVPNLTDDGLIKILIIKLITRKKTTGIRKNKLKE